MKKYYQPEIETASRDQIIELQNEKIVKQVKHVYENVAYYRELMDEKGVKPEDIKSIDDIKKLPFLSKSDLRDAYPYGLLGADLKDCVRIQSTSGTTGKRVVAFYTQHDVDLWEDCCARAITAAGGTSEDVCQVAYGYGLFTGGLGAHYGAEYLGALVLPMSTGNTQKLIDMMIDCDVTSIACTPSYLLHVAEDLEKMGLVDKIKLKSAICGAEPWTNEMRDQMESRLHIKAYDIYGLTEMMGPGVACDCEYHKGLHIWEDHFLPEIIDPATLKQLPKGSDGELVITNLTKEGMPLIRYRTKDLTSIEYDKCECGRTMARIQRFRGRSDDMLIIRGVNVFPSQVEAALLTIEGTTPHYMLVVDRVDNNDTLEVQVEVAENAFTDEISSLEKLSKEIHAKLKQAIGLNAKVKLVEPNGLEHFDGKSKHVTDKRKLYQ